MNDVAAVVFVVGGGQLKMYVGDFDWLANGGGHRFGCRLRMKSHNELRQHVEAEKAGSDLRESEEEGVVENFCCHCGERVWWRRRVCVVRL